MQNSQNIIEGFQPLLNLFAQLRSKFSVSSCKMFLHSSWRIAVRGFAQSAGRRIPFSHAAQSFSFASRNASACRLFRASTIGAVARSKSFLTMSGRIATVKVKTNIPKRTAKNKYVRIYSSLENQRNSTCFPAIQDKAGFIYDASCRTCRHRVGHYSSMFACVVRLDSWHLGAPFDCEYHEVLMVSPERRKALQGVTL